LVAAAQPRSLSIYWIDVEGGAATLIVTPEGQSLLGDTGNAGNNDRDAKRIAAAAKQAGLTKLDFVLITHFHLDHVGGVGALAKLIPIGRFLDHGDSVELGNPRDAELWKIYQTVSAGKRTILKPGDKLPLKGVESVVVTSNGQTIAKPLNGGGPNAFCAGAKQHDPDTTENQLSLGFLLTYGKFKFLDLGDLTWDKEMELACPVNKLGTVALLQATHHGFYRDYSGAPALVWALKPQVVVANNGPQKGMQESAWDTISKIPGLEGLWQVHLALGSDAAHNTAPDQIANLEPSADCQGHWLKASIGPDGKFTLTNSRNNVSKSYTAK
jgi:competence protein ComEC